MHEDTRFPIKSEKDSIHQAATEQISRNQSLDNNNNNNNRNKQAEMINNPTDEQHDHRQDTSGQAASKLNEKRPHGNMRFFIAFLGLSVAAVNYYSLASFCIAIVEMVAPSDNSYHSPFKDQVHSDLLEQAINQTRTLQVTTHGSQRSDIQQSSDESCPILFEYRHYYDDWRFQDQRLSSPSLPSVHLSVNSSASFSNDSIHEQDNIPQSPQLPYQGRRLDSHIRFNWDATQQGLLLAAPALGTAPLLVLSGRLAEVYGPKWVLLFSCLGTTVTNFLVPANARWSFLLLFLNRVLMGVTQGGLEPGLMCLLANWLTPNEVGFFISMLLFAICIGNFIGAILCTYLLGRGFGWPMTHYTSGVLNLIVGLLWLFYATNKPSESRHISKEEMDYIHNQQASHKSNRKGAPSEIMAPPTPTFVPVILVKANQGSPILDDDKMKTPINENQPTDSHSVGRDSKKDDQYRPTNNEQLASDLSSISIGSDSMIDKPDTPWREILCYPPVWAFIICKVSIRWTADTIAIMLPSYLAEVLHLSIKVNGLINGLSTALFALFSLAFAYIFNKMARSLDQRQAQQEINLAKGIADQGSSARLSKTNLRKLAQSVASFGSTIGIVLMTRYACDINFSISMLFVVSCCLVLGTGGELQIPYDMSSIYPGTLHGMACTLSVSGWLAPSLIGFILADKPHSVYRWTLVWYVTAGINFIGGLVFVLWADARPRDFDQIRNDKRSKRGARNKGDINVRKQRIDDDDDDDYIEDKRTSGGAKDLYRTSLRKGDMKLGLIAETRSGSNQENHSGQNLIHESQFDGQKIRIRQPGNCFIQSPSSLSGLDSLPATLKPMFPYKKEDTDFP